MPTTPMREQLTALTWGPQGGRSFVRRRELGEAPREDRNGLDLEERLSVLLNIDVALDTNRIPV